MSTQLTGPPSITSRSFSLHYGRGLARQVTASGPAPALPPSTGEDTTVVRHLNGICVLCLSPNHPVVRRGLKVKAVKYRENIDRPVSGKRKRGGTSLYPDSKVAMVVCEDGQTFSVLASVKGVLVEINAALSRRPELLLSKPLTDGYLAVILPAEHERGHSPKNLASQDPFCL